MNGQWNQILKILERLEAMAIMLQAEVNLIRLVFVSMTVQIFHIVIFLLAQRFICNVTTTQNITDKKCTFPAIGNRTTKNLLENVRTILIADAMKKLTKKIIYY